MGAMVHSALDRIEYGDAPAVLVYADGRQALERGRAQAERAGCRVAAGGLIRRSVPRFDRIAATPPIVVELAGPSEAPATAAFLDRLRAEAERRGRRSVIAAAPAFTDLVAARAWHRDIVHQCDPGPVERLAAIAAVTRPPPARLHDIGRESSALLQQLSEEVSRIANILATMSEEGEAPALGQPAGAAEAEGDEPPIPAAFVRSIIRARRLREQYFRGDLFADPAWDMLLDLMVARLERNRVAVSSLCIAAAVPATTALRWIKALTDRGLFVRSADPEDGRRVYIELSDDAARSLAAYLRAVQRISQIAV